MHFTSLILAFSALATAFPQNGDGVAWDGGKDSHGSWGKAVDVKNINQNNKNIYGGDVGGFGGNLQVGGGGGGGNCDPVACDIQV